ncbi:hypothetical protein Tco_0669889 [Tanacetum coccineum]
MPGFHDSVFYQNFPSYQQMREFHGYPMKVKRLSDKDESIESDEASRKSDENGSEIDEDVETTPVENNESKKDKFWNMAPLLNDPS